MSVLANLPATPNRVGILFRFLREFDQGLPEDELKAILSPQALQGNDEPEDDEPEDDVVPQRDKTIAASVLSEAITLNLVTVSGGVASVPAPLRSLDEAGLLEHLEQTLLQPDLAMQAGQPHFAQALTWLLLQDPRTGLRWSENYKKQIMDAFSDQKAFGLSNNRRFQNLIYWARYLGYAWRLNLNAQSNQVMPDPTDALARHIRGVMAPGQKMEIADLFARLAQRSPVLEGGNVRTAFEQRLPESERRPDTLLSRSTSLALLRLERRGFIARERMADSAAWRLGTWPTEEPVSHITRLG